MKSTTLYLYTLAAFVLLGSAFAYYYDDIGDDDDDGIKVSAFGANDDGFHTDKEMRELNKRLDTTVEIVDKVYEKYLKKFKHQYIKKILSDPKPPKMTKEQWEEIKNKRIEEVPKKIYKQAWNKVYRTYENFITKKESDAGITMSSWGPDNKSIFNLPKGYVDDEVEDEILSKLET